MLKACAFDELKRAIQVVSAGKSYLSPEVTELVVEERLDASSDTPSMGTELGPREREVLQLLAEGRTSGEIAQRLGISTRTVETHRRNLMRKLGLHSVAELTKYTVREGLTPLDR